MAEVERPLIPLPRSESVATRPSKAKPRGGAKGPKKARVVDRLSPSFSLLHAALEERRAELQADPAGVAPEQVIVLETNGPVKELVEAVQATKGLEWLAEEELAEVLPDADFFIPGKPGKLLTARLYMVMTNQAALEQFLSLWALWTKSKRLPVAFRAWTKVFGKLRDVRRWGPIDRLRETGILQDWQERKRLEEASAPVEVEFWFRRAEEREAAVRRVTSLVQGLEGQILRSATIPEIHYHALLAKLPAASVEQLLGDRSVRLVKSDDVRLFRPMPQAAINPSQDVPLEDAPDADPPQHLLEPVVALLDGLPVENHEHLRGRLSVEDPQEWSRTYPVASRRHGTAMAGLIIRGDLKASRAPSRHRLYVRPILRPDARGLERAPDDALWVDLIHQAVRRAVVGEGSTPASAKSVRIVNLSVGDYYQPFVGSAVSPLARLLDWLSWEYGLLFVVSAGNHRDDITVDGVSASHLASEEDILRALQAEQRHRRLLSPAESINALTVGALHHDECGPVTPRYPEERLLVSTAGMPAPYSAMGRGFRRAVKPDILAPGGRAVYAGKSRAATGGCSFEFIDRPLEVPGNKVAAPTSRGTWFQCGTSNAAAVTTRAAEDLLGVARGVVARDPELAKIPEALLVKALLVHTAEWPHDAYAVFRRALRTEKNRSQFDDIVSAFLGYGALRYERALECTRDRVTLLGGDVIGEGETRLHRIPLPVGLNAFTGRRRVTTTLAWFSPINPNDRRYRCASLSFAPLTNALTPLLLTNADVHLNAVRRGTIQHVVLEGESGAINVREDDALNLEVTCEFESKNGFGIRVPYALAVTLEVAPELAIPIYDAIRELVRPKVAVRVGAH